MNSCVQEAQDGNRSFSQITAQERRFEIDRIIENEYSGL
jgi:hypothetical protein